jgi:hypothetical protein
VFAVIQDQQSALGADSLLQAFDERPPRFFGHTVHRGDSLHYLARVLDRTKLDEGGAVWVLPQMLGSDPECDARLANACYSRDRYQT